MGATHAPHSRIRNRCTIRCAAKRANPFAEDGSPESQLVARRRSVTIENREKQRALRWCLRLSPGPSRVQEKQRIARMISYLSLFCPAARRMAVIGPMVVALLVSACGSAVVKPASLEQANALSTQAAAGE